MKHNVINYNHISVEKLFNYVIEGCDSFVLSNKTIDINIDFKSPKSIFDFSSLDKDHEMFSNESKKVVGKFKNETPKNIWIDEFIAFISKAYSFKCGDKNTNKLKSSSNFYSENNNFEENKKCLDGEKYQMECDNYLPRSNNLEMYLQNVTQKISSIFDDKRNCLDYIENILWNEIFYVVDFFIWNVIDMGRCAHICDFKCDFVGLSFPWDNVNYDWHCGTTFLVWHWVWVIVVDKLLDRKWVCCSDRCNVLGMGWLWSDEWCCALDDRIYDLVYEVSAVWSHIRFGIWVCALRWSQIRFL